MKTVRGGLVLLAALLLLGLSFALREVKSQEATAPAADAGDTEEKVSADNNLSFPVDI